MNKPRKVCHSVVYNDNNNGKIYWDSIAFIAQPINSYMWQIKNTMVGKLSRV